MIEPQDREIMSGRHGAVAANHVVGLRILSHNDGFIVEALTTDWAIQLCAFKTFDEAETKMDDYAKMLRDR